MISYTRFAAALLTMVLLHGCFEDTSRQGKTATTSSSQHTNQVTKEKALSENTVINGFRLPPEPDPQINNSTLLGIDSNNNGVRDDVERWTILKYKDKHPIVTLIGLQGAKAAQIIIQEPEKARETTHYFEAAANCSFYFQYEADFNGEPLLVDEFMWGDEFNNVQFNTTQRVKAYATYNAALSGGVYGIPSSQIMRSQCDFAVTEMLKNGQ